MDMRLIALVLLTAVITTDALGQTNDVTIDGNFADWADEFCVADADPADCDDFPNQQDSKGACIASNWTSPGPADTIYLRFDFDDVVGSGANTLDACWLIDIDQDGNTDRAICFGLDSPPMATVAETIETLFFTCNDTAVTCAGSVEVPSSAVCAFNPAVADADQLADCDVPDTDLAVECSAPLTDLGWTGGVVSLITGCTSTSPQPGSATFDCFDGLVIDPETGGNLPVELQYFGIE